MIGNFDRLTLRRGGLPLFGALLGCLFLPSLASAQNGSPVTRAQFDSNGAKGMYSYEIKESTRGERLAVGAWTGSSHVVLRWAPTGGNDQRLLFLSEPGGKKFRIKTLRGDVNDPTIPNCALTQPDFEAQFKAGNLAFRIPLQMLGLGLIGSLAEGREVVRKSVAVVTYEPKELRRWDEEWPRFAKLVPA